MMFKKSIENMVYLGLYILSLILFFLWGNVGNNKILFSAAHILCVTALAINTNRKVASFFLKSLVIYSLISSTMWAAHVSYAISCIPFILTGFLHIMALNDKDLFGRLIETQESFSTDWMKIFLWTLITIAVLVIFITF